MEAASVEYPLALPAANPLTLTFAVSGGGIFTVKAAPDQGSGEFRTLYERMPSATNMEYPARVDLANFAGTSIRLRFEARDPTGEAQWVEPAIVAGNAPQAPRISAGCPDSQSCWARRAAATVQLWQGSRGVLDAPIGLVCGERKLFFRGFRVRVAATRWRNGARPPNCWKRARSRRRGVIACATASATGPARST